MKLVNEFSEWENDIHNCFKEDCGEFHDDGVVNEEDFRNAKYQLLFIAKEPNAKNHERMEGRRDFRKWLIDENINQWPKFKENLGRWAYGILKNFPEYGEVNTRESQLWALQRIAFINLKKTGGGGSIKESFRRHIKEPKILALIKNQIIAINPSHIILCLGELDHLSKYIFCEAETIVPHDRVGMAIEKWNDIKVIHFYHPSGYSSNQMMYYYLKVMWDECCKQNGSIKPHSPNPAITK